MFLELLQNCQIFYSMASKNDCSIDQFGNIDDFFVRPASNRCAVGSSKCAHKIRDSRRCIANRLLQNKALKIENFEINNSSLTKRKDRSYDLLELACSPIKIHRKDVRIFEDFHFRFFIFYFYYRRTIWR